MPVDPKRTNLVFKPAINGLKAALEMPVSYGYLLMIRKEGISMRTRHKEYRQLSCRDFGSDCDFMVRAETEEEVMKYGHEHGCNVHSKCGISSEAEKKMKSHVKNVWV